jgi:mercuric transport protein
MLKKLAGIALFSLLASSVYADGAESVTLDVKGMTCATCPIAVKAMLKKQPGVTDVKVDLKKGTADIAFDSAKVKPQRLAELVSEAGFPSTVRK